MSESYDILSPKDLIPKFPRMSVVAHNIENDVHFLTFPSHIAQDEYEDIFSEIYSNMGDLTKIKLIVDLSKMDYINSGFIGMVSELFSVTVDDG